MKNFILSIVLFISLVSVGFAHEIGKGVVIGNSEYYNKNGQVIGRLIDRNCKCKILADLTDYYLIDLDDFKYYGIFIVKKNDVIFLK
jgi:hypothetical protein